MQHTSSENSENCEAQHMVILGWHSMLTWYSGLQAEQHRVWGEASFSLLLAWNPDMSMRRLKRNVFWMCHEDYEPVPDIADAQADLNYFNKLHIQVILGPLSSESKGGSYHDQACLMLLTYEFC